MSTTEFHQKHDPVVHYGTHEDRTKPPAILVVDNQPKRIPVLLDQLVRAKFTVEVAVSPEEAKSLVERRVFDLALIDICFSDPKHDRDRSGLELARDMLLLAPETAVVFISRPDIIAPEDVLAMFNWIPS